MVGPDGTSSLVFILGALVFATLLGTVNATAIAYGRVVPFIATLAMFSIARGLALLLNDKLPVSLLDLNGGSFGDPATFSLLWFGTGRILGIPVSVYVFLAITIARLDPAQPHALRALRRLRRRQPRGGADRRRPGPQDHLQRLRALGLPRGDRHRAALRAAGQRLSGERKPLRARRDRRRRDRRHEPGRGPGDDRRHVPRRPHLRADLQPDDTAQPLDRDPAGDEGRDRRSAPSCSSARRRGTMPERPCNPSRNRRYACR